LSLVGCSCDENTNDNAKIQIFSKNTQDKGCSMKKVCEMAKIRIELAFTMSEILLAGV
jgi:hypothetical protein